VWANQTGTVLVDARTGNVEAVAQKLAGISYDCSRKVRSA
jgi:hypothetical protein